MAPTSQPVIPAWVAPPPAAVHDLLTVAAHYGRAGDPHAQGCLDGAQWVTGWPDVTADDAGREMMEALDDRHTDKRRAGVADVLAWLSGFGPAPLTLPRRSADGTLVTAQQLYDERAAQAPLRWTPEERREQRQHAERDAARSARLADLS